jgi:hypothetical protein
MVSIYNSLWSLGAIVAAWTTYGTFRIMNTWAWRIPSILQALSSLIQIFCFWWIVESPRWLVSKDRCDEAQAIITRVSAHAVTRKLVVTMYQYHANSDPHDPIVLVELEEIKEALRLEQESAKTSSYLAFFKTRGNMLRFFIILAVGFFSQWSGNGLISVSGDQICRLVHFLTSRLVLLDLDPRFNWHYFPRNSDLDQRYSYYLEPRNLPGLLPPRQQIQTAHHVSHIHGLHVDLLHCMDRP